MKPKFVRQNISRKRLIVKWRRPRGLHSKLRLNKAGHIKKPSPGFRKARKERIQTITLVKNLKDLTNAKQNILLSSNIGLKKKIEILKKSKDLKLNVLNVNLKNIDEFIKRSNDLMERKKQEKKKKQVDKKKSEERAVKSAEKKDEAKTPAPETSEKEQKTEQ